MTGSRLKRIANKTNKPEDILAFKKQRNLVVNLNKREKKRFFEKAGSPSSKFISKFISHISHIQIHATVHNMLFLDYFAIVTNRDYHHGPFKSFRYTTA